MTTFVISLFVCLMHLILLFFYINVLDMFWPMRSIFWAWYSILKMWCSTRDLSSPFWANGLIVNIILWTVSFLESLKGARVLVTGASTGIGEQLAYHYARLGAQLVITARRGNVLEQVSWVFFFHSSFTWFKDIWLLHLNSGCEQVLGNGGSKGIVHPCGHGKPLRCWLCGAVRHRTAWGSGLPGSEPHWAQSIQNVGWRRGAHTMAARGVESQWNNLYWQKWLC